MLDDGIVIEIVQNRIENFAVGSGGFDNLDGGEIRSIDVGLAVVDALLLLDKAVIAFHFGGRLKLRKRGGAYLCRCRQLLKQHVGRLHHAR